MGEGRMKIKLIGVLIIWGSIIAFSLYWNIQSTRSNQARLTLQTAQTLFDQMVITRQWNSNHNGVYVKITDQTQPNPYLVDEQRDLNCDGILVTKINPAYMTRQLSEMSDKNMGVQFHVAGLKPLRPGNEPNAWERVALENFSKGKGKEKGELIKRDKDKYFLYMKALIAEPSCISCHAQKGYKEGDVLGGISIKILNPEKAKLFPIILGHLIIGGLGALFILMSGLKLIEAYKTIHHQAIFDGLTNIHNRRYFNDRITMEVKRAQRLSFPFSVIMIDIDNFKNYNDYYGHVVGDKALILIAQSIKSTLNRPVDFCARYGGEEFIIILPETDEAGAIHIAKNLLSNIRQLNLPHEKSTISDVVTVSLGIATETCITCSADEIVKMADNALYLAKANGKDRFKVFT